MDVTNQYPRGVAYHEAGHAVVAWALGVPVGTVHVRESDASGGTDIGATDHLTRIERIALCYAGYAAEKVFGYPAHEQAPFDDRWMILNLLAGIPENKHRAFRDAGYNLARTCLEANRSKVIFLAERLVEHGRVERAEFLRLMNGEGT